MIIEMGRARTSGLAASALMLFLVPACVSSSGVEPEPGPAHPRRPERAVAEVPRPYAVRGAPTRVASCPMPAPNASPLPLFSKTLFYVHANYPEDISPRSRDLLLGALDAVAQQDHDILVEREPDSPPRWVTLTIGGQPCTLNIERVDAPWTLRSTLQQAFRFLQVHLASAPSAESEQRLSDLEVAAINGMLSTLDGRSQLLDPATYRQIRPHVGPATGTAPGAPHPPEPSKASDAVTRPWTPSFPRAASGQTIEYLPLLGFPPGVSGELEKTLLASEAAPPKGFILDLRDSSGGLVEEAVRVADAFIKTGTLGSIVGQRKRKDYVAHGDGHEPTGALVVLVNRRTVGAAELVAAAVKNLERGIVLGEPTAGAGMIQQMFDLPRIRHRPPPADRDVVQNVLDNVPPPKPVDELEGDALGLYLTTGRLLAAGGAEIEHAGVQPDVEMAWPPGKNRQPDEDCVRQFAEALIAGARDPSRSTLLATAKTLPAEGLCRSVGLRGG